MGDSDGINEGNLLITQLLRAANHYRPIKAGVHLNADIYSILPAAYLKGTYNYTDFESSFSTTIKGHKSIPINDKNSLRTKNCIAMS